MMIVDLSKYGLDETREKLATIDTWPKGAVVVCHSPWLSVADKRELYNEILRLVPDPRRVYVCPERYGYKKIPLVELLAYPGNANVIFSFMLKSRSNLRAFCRNVPIVMLFIWLHRNLRYVVSDYKFGETEGFLGKSALEILHEQKVVESREMPYVASTLYHVASVALAAANIVPARDTVDATTSVNTTDIDSDLSKQICVLLENVYAGLVVFYNIKTEPDPQHAD